MLIIRLQRKGAKNAPDFRLVLAEKHRSATKKVLEVFGGYNPKTKDLKLVQQEKLLEWVKRGVELSPTAKNLLINKKVITGTKVKAWRPKVKEKPEEKPAEKKAEPKAQAPAESAPTEEKKNTAEQPPKEKIEKEEKKTEEKSAKEESPKSV